MLPDAASWNQASAYDYWDELSPEGLAWEFLRRNGDYQQAFSDQAADADDWGLRTLRDPALTAGEGVVHWKPGLNTSEILLTHALPQGTSSLTPAALPPPVEGVDDQGRFGVIGQPGAGIHVSWIGDTADTSPLCIVIPLDACLSERIDALNRFRRVIAGQAAPDRRLTTDKRRRLRQMARASDGRAAGATHREIAEALFGRHRTASEIWKTSSLRYTVMRLLNDAVGMSDGGYLQLLRTPDAGVYAGSAGVRN